MNETDRCREEFEKWWNAYPLGKFKAIDASDVFNAWYAAWNMRPKPMSEDQVRKLAKSTFDLLYTPMTNFNRREP